MIKQRLFSRPWFPRFPFLCWQIFKDLNRLIRFGDYFYRILISSSCIRRFGFLWPILSVFCWCFYTFSMTLYTLSRGVWFCQNGNLVVVILLSVFFTRMCNININERMGWNSVHNSREKNTGKLRSLFIMRFWNSNPCGKLENNPNQNFGSYGLNLGC